uniref:Uncharacterized protein n=1 Tax=Alexandrium andersonii TaxID=327968 RepID=A0A7S2MIU6_9DINO
MAGMKDFARSIPVRDFACGLFGDVGASVAGFVGGDALNTISEGHQTLLDSSDCPDGHRVLGARCIALRAPGNGRAAFVIDDEASISTAGQRPVGYHANDDESESEYEGSDAGSL